MEEKKKTYIVPAFREIALVSEMNFATSSYDDPPEYDDWLN